MLSSSLASSAVKNLWKKDNLKLVLRARIVHLLKFASVETVVKRNVPHVTTVNVVKLAFVDVAKRAAQRIVNVWDHLFAVLQHVFQHAHPIATVEAALFAKIPPVLLAVILITTVFPASDVTLKCLFVKLVLSTVKPTLIVLLELVALMDNANSVAVETLTVPQKLLALMSSANSVAQEVLTVLLE